jgi:hypothetical protein
MSTAFSVVALLTDMLLHGYERNDVSGLAVGGRRENVNRLVDALRTHRQVIDLALDRGEAPFELLVDALGDALLSGPERDLIGRDAELSQRLNAGYLPVITAPEWDSALSEAAEDTSLGADWWTVMIPSASRAAGLTVPQDSSAADLVALFDGRGPDAQLLAYDPAVGAFADTSRTGHCAPPTRGRCGDGMCGQCQARRVWDKATGMGIKCRCPHPAR